MQEKETRSHPEIAEHNKDVVPQYVTYPMTDFETIGNKKHGPLVSDDNVLRAKKYVDENHK